MARPLENERPVVYDVKPRAPVAYVDRQRDDGNDEEARDRIDAAEVFGKTKTTDREKERERKRERKRERERKEREREEEEKDKDELAGEDGGRCEGCE